MGWAFKANTNDSRESPAIFVAEKLYKAGATLEIYDPMVSEEFIKRDVSFYWNEYPKIIPDRIKVLNESPNFEDIDLSTILTEWDEFKHFDFKKSKVFDGRSIINQDCTNITYSVGK